MVKVTKFGFPTVTVSAQQREEPACGRIPPPPPACLGLSQVSTHAVYVSLTYLLSLTKFSCAKIFIFTVGVNFVPFYHFKFANVVPHTSVKKNFRNPLLKMVK